MAQYVPSCCVQTDLLVWRCGFRPDLKLHGREKEKNSEIWRILRAAHYTVKKNLRIFSWDMTGLSRPWLPFHSRRWPGHCVWQSRTEFYTWGSCLLPLTTARCTQNKTHVQQSRNSNHNTHICIPVQWSLDMCTDHYMHGKTWPTCQSCSQTSLQKSERWSETVCLIRSANKMKKISHELISLILDKDL